MSEELECRLGNVRVPCNANQALALLLNHNLPKINRQLSGSQILVFRTDQPVSICGSAEELKRLCSRASSLRFAGLINGSVVAKWMQLMQVPQDCLKDCSNLNPDMLNIVWMRALRQKMPITTVLKIYTA
ncbi:hypothetical protein GF391_00830 [Candidatus Uhrbacteria bacterium]|nr:hypothetical protein [Candidatus Uhrbacteria bacterium]